MEKLLHIVQTINFYLSDYILVILLVGTGLFFSVKTKFVQFRCFGEGMKKVFGKFSLHGGKQENGLSSFQALATAIAAQVGTGNIIGACGAILTGGPGSIFWMWIIALFGMATVYAEAVLAQETRIVHEDGTILGGPVYYIKRAYNNHFGKILAACFSAALILALGFMGCMVQSNSIGATCSTAFGLPSWTVGIVVALFAGFIFLGGVSRIASVTEKLVPVMAALYLLGCLVVLVLRIRYLPETFGLIFRYAFMPNAIIGGSLGYALKMAVSQGVKRGLFSNEAGMGSTPHAHAMANVETPHDQGVVAMIGVFIDTCVVLTATALIVISTLYAGNGILASGTAEGVNKANMAQLAFSSVFGAGLGNKFVAVCLLFFAFSTIISWNLFGKINVIYLFGKKAVPVYSALALVFIVLGSCLSNDLVWELADMFNQLMVIPNVMALIVLSGAVAESAGRRKK
jgi:AGCS family alanine or glycine:cation symporter